MLIGSEHGGHIDGGYENMAFLIHSFLSACFCVKYVIDAVSCSTGNRMICTIVVYASATNESHDITLQFIEV